MVVAVARLVLHIPGARSLKDKRQVVRSFKERAKARLHLSVAEVGDADRLQVATFAVAVVSNDAGTCQEQLSHVRSLANHLPEALLADFREQLISFGEDGKALLDRAPFDVGADAFKDQEDDAQ